MQPAFSGQMNLVHGDAELIWKRNCIVHTLRLQGSGPIRALEQRQWHRPCTKPEGIRVWSEVEPFSGLQMVRIPTGLIQHLSLLLLSTALIGQNLCNPPTQSIPLFLSLTSMLCSVYSLPTGILRLLWLRFFSAFSSVVRPMPGYTSQRWGTVHTLPNQWIVLLHVLFVSTVLFSVLFVCKCALYYCHWVATQLQLNYHIISTSIWTKFSHPGDGGSTFLWNVQARLLSEKLLKPNRQ